MADSYRQVTAPLIGKGRVKGSFIPTLQRCQNIKCQMSISASPLSNVVLFRLVCQGLAEVRIRADLLLIAFHSLRHFQWLLGFQCIYCFM